MARPGASARSAPHSRDGVRLMRAGPIVCPATRSPQASAPAPRHEHFDPSESRKACAEGDCGAALLRRRSRA